MIAGLQREIDAALAARARLCGRSVRETAAALAAAGARWRSDPALSSKLPEAAHLGAGMVRAVLPIVASQLDAALLCEVHAREASGTPPALVAHVLASNVPGLAVPAIALSCLAGAATVVKSGRADRLSAPAFHRALAAVDPDLAATVVTAYWPGGATDVEDAILGRADLVVASGADASVGTLARRLGTRVVAQGGRTSVAVALGDVDDAVVAGLATDVALYEQRGCLSPHRVFVVGDAAGLAERLRAALDDVARSLPRPPATTAERAAHRLAVEEARFGGATVLESTGGTVIVGGTATEVGRRTVFVHALETAGEVGTRIAPATVECVGVAGVVLDADMLRRRGVARLCPIGAMQRPRIDWPRGQRPALGSLFRLPSEPRIQVEA
ncbi:MAG TPA: acyl-CoA reductase [Candidatus Eisenbacteria bacterium]|nr:acyl-CoA reductase [Candidatus Eisenbacteria bacterium]